MQTSELFQEEILLELFKVLPRDRYSVVLSETNGFEVWDSETEGVRYSVYFDSEAVMLRHFSFHAPTSGCQCPQRRDDLLFADPAVHPEAVAKTIAQDLANTLPFAEALEVWNARQE